MNPWYLRGLLGLSLIAVIAVRATPAQPAIADIEPRAIAYLQAKGWQQIPTPPPKPLKVLAFHAPDCDRQIDIVPLDTNFEGRAWFDRIGTAGDRRRFFYLDRQWTSPNAWAVGLTRIVYNELGLLRLSRFDATTQMLMIVEPSSCHLVEAIDWQTLWVRPNA